MNKKWHTEEEKNQEEEEEANVAENVVHLVLILSLVAVLACSVRLIIEPKKEIWKYQRDSIIGHIDTVWLKPKNK